MVGAVAIFLGYALSTFSAEWLFLALAGYVVQWLGDSLDGSLARFRHIERPSYGYFIDHSCDGLAGLLIFAGMGLSPFVTMDIALIALARSEEHTSELQSLMRISYAVLSVKKKQVKSSII